MKWLVTIFLGLLIITWLPAQQEESLNWDIDSIFDESLVESPAEETESNANGITVMDMMKRRGFTFDASFAFTAGIAPGWYETPWSPDSNMEDYYVDRLIKMRGTFSLDAQISDVLRVKSSIYYEIPNFRFRLGDFFFDYNLYDAVFFRGGKYNLSWGISPNYAFTNLLARIPGEEYNSDSFIFKIDIPAGIGGFQLLSLTRAPLMSMPSDERPKLKDFGFGGKYNMAFRHIDTDLGVYYQEGMPIRSFLSLKTTIGNTELYSEGLLAFDADETSNVSGAVNLGFGRDFFDRKLTVNGELFYNAEKGTFWYQPETTIQDSEALPFVEGFNMALNLLYRFQGKGDLRFFIQTRYAPWQNSAQIVPGFRLNPWSHIELYLAVPMALGSKTGYYYSNTFYKVDKTQFPFAVVFLATLRGNVQAARYY